MSSNNFQFLDSDLLKYLICSLCNKVMRNPTRLHICGHSFCEACVQGSFTCPNCSMEVKARQADLTAGNLISDLQVKCLSKDCPYQGSYEAYLLTHDKSCSLRSSGSIQNWISDVKETLRQSRPMGLVEQCQPIELPQVELELPVQLEEKPERSSDMNQTFIQCIALDAQQEKKDRKKVKKGQLKDKGAVIQLSS